MKLIAYAYLFCLLVAALFVAGYAYLSRVITGRKECRISRGFEGYIAEFFDQ